MTVRDALVRELEAVIARRREYATAETGHRWDVFSSAAYRLIGDHGPALLAMVGDAERYRWLRDSTANHLIVSHNAGHEPNYMTAAEWIETNPAMFDDDSPENLSAMADSGSIWEVQWYPHTPVGFNCVFAADLDQAIDQARAEGGA